MQWKRRSTAIVLLLVGLGIAGCGGTTDLTDSSSPKFGRVRVACPATLGETVIRPYARNWEGQTEGQIEIVAYDPRTVDPPGEADLWVIPPASLPRWAAAGKLQTLPEPLTTGEGFGWKSLLPIYRDKLAVWDRKRYGVPLLGESLLCCYRNDWLADPMHQRAFEDKYKRKLEPAATWEHYADIAEFFSLYAQPEKVPSLPPLPVDGDELEREFYTMAANYAVRAVAEGETVVDDHLLFSFQYNSASGEPRLNSAGSVQALQLLKRLQEYRPRGEASNPAEAFAAGKAVLCLAETWQLAAFQKCAKVKDRFAVCRMPGAPGYYDFEQPQQWRSRVSNRVPYLGGGGWLGVVPKGAKEEQAAWSLLAHLGGPAVSKQVVIDPAVGGGPTRQEHLDSGTRWDTFGLDPARTAAVKDALRQTLEHVGLKNPAMVLRTPEEAAHRLALQEELRSALKGDKTPEQALHDAAARWSKMDHEKGLAAHRAAYRISVGLLPKE